mgnify:CR=1 FL=1
MSADRPISPPDVLLERPRLAALLGLLLLVTIAYALLVRQELFLLIWLLLVLFFAHLALRFVRATERLAGAAETYVETEE